MLLVCESCCWLPVLWSHVTRYSRTKESLPPNTNPPPPPNNKTSPLLHIGTILGGFTIRGLGGFSIRGRGLICFARQQHSVYVVPRNLVAPLVVIDSQSQHYLRTCLCRAAVKELSFTTIQKPYIMNYIFILWQLELSSLTGTQYVEELTGSEGCANSEHCSQATWCSELQCKECYVANDGGSTLAMVKPLIRGTCRDQIRSL